MATNKQVTLTVRAVANQAIAEAQKLRVEMEKVKGNTEKLQERLNKAGKDTGKFGGKLDQLAGQFGQLDPRVSGVVDLLGGARAASLVGVAAGAVIGIEKLSRTTLEYNNILQNVPYELTRAKEATKGLVSELELSRLAITANRFGVAKSSEEFAELAQIATTLGRSVGLDATKSVEDMTTALSRQSPQILDNLGIKLSLNDAYKIYADRIGKSVDALTEQEKQQAFATAALIKGREAIQDIKTDTDSWALSIQQAKVSLQDAGTWIVANAEDIYKGNIRAFAAAFTLGTSELAIYVSQLDAVKSRYSSIAPIAQEAIANAERAVNTQRALNVAYAGWLKLGPDTESRLNTLSDAYWNLGENIAAAAAAAERFRQETISGKRTGALYAETAKLGYEVFKVYEKKKTKDADEAAKELATKIGLLEDKRHKSAKKNVEDLSDFSLASFQRMQAEQAAYEQAIQDRNKRKMQQDARELGRLLAEERAAGEREALAGSLTGIRRGTELSIAGGANREDAVIQQRADELAALRAHNASKQDIAAANDAYEEALHQKQIARIQDRVAAEQEKQRKIEMYSGRTASAIGAASNAAIDAHIAEGQSVARAVGDSLMATGRGAMTEGGVGIAKGALMLALGNPQGAAVIGAAAGLVGVGAGALAAGKAFGGSLRGGGGGPAVRAANDSGRGRSSSSSINGVGSSVPSKQVDIPPSAMPPTSGNHGPPNDSRITRHNQAASGSMGSTGAGGGNTYHFNVVGSIDEDAAMRISQGLQQHERRAGRLAV